MKKTQKQALIIKYVQMKKTQKQMDVSSDTTALTSLIHRMRNWGAIVRDEDENTKVMEYVQLIKKSIDMLQIISIISQMLDDHFFPNNVIITQLIRTAGELKDMDAVFAFHQLAVEKNIDNAFTYYSTIKGIANNPQPNNVEHALAILEQAKVKNMENKYTYIFTLHAIANSQEPNVELTIKLLEEAKEKNIVNVVTYLNTLDVLAKSDRQKHEELAYSLLDQTIQQYQIIDINHAPLLKFKALSFGLIYYEIKQRLTMYLATPTEEPICFGLIYGRALDSQQRYFKTEEHGQLKQAVMIAIQDLNADTMITIEEQTNFPEGLNIIIHPKVKLQDASCLSEKIVELTQLKRTHFAILDELEALQSQLDEVTDEDEDYTSFSIYALEADLARLDQQLAQTLIENKHLDGSLATLVQDAEKKRNQASFKIEFDLYHHYQPMQKDNDNVLDELAQYHKEAQLEQQQYERDLPELQRNIADTERKELELASVLTLIQGEHDELHVELDEINMTQMCQDELKYMLSCTDNPALRSAIYFRLAYIEKDNGDLFNAFHHFHLAFQNKKTQPLYQKAIKEMEALEDRILDPSDLSLLQFNQKARMKYDQNRLDEARVFCLKSLECIGVTDGLSKKNMTLISSTYWILMEIYLAQNDWINLDKVYKQLKRTEGDTSEFRKKMNLFISNIRFIHNDNIERNLLIKILFYGTELAKDSFTSTLITNPKQGYIDIQRQPSSSLLDKAMASLSLMDLYIIDKDSDNLAKQGRNISETISIPSFLIGWFYYYYQNCLFNGKKSREGSIQAYNKALDCCSSLFEARHARHILIQKELTTSATPHILHPVIKKQSLCFFSLEQDEQAGEEMTVGEALLPP